VRAAAGAESRTSSPGEKENHLAKRMGDVAEGAGRGAWDAREPTIERLYKGPERVKPGGGGTANLNSSRETT